MSKITGLQLFLSGCGAAAAYFLLRDKGDKKDPKDPRNSLNDSGLDPNYAGGRIINALGPVDTHDSFRPSCQIFDPASQLYVNAGNKDWDKSKDACFASNDSSRMLRYVDATGAIQFKVEDPLQEPPDEAGLCYFYDGKGQYFTFPNYNGITPVNRSARLCFSAGESYVDAGRYFERSTDKKRWVNPNIPWTLERQDEHYRPTDFDTLTDPNDRLAILPPETDQCQFNSRIFSSGNLSQNTLQAWVRTQKSSAFDTNIMGCLGAGGRIWQRSKNKVLYLNPFNQQPVQTPMYATTN